MHAVVQSMACTTQDGQIGRQLCAETFIGPVVHLEAIGMGDVERAAVARV
jgi:hypothetical protein